ncbi:MarR family winged helix-turn-helix transcriptional regulator [Streptococcus phocae subsp. phocae]|uniref:MarR family transcriptional regulator n=1 Tax=Streptococcus phocae TaxID=119224 RepID=A0A0P6S1D8_9STRE|nr:MarR family transcriptional regulator [Streptococcus phocae]KGR72709.1 MarR family transcriptional regulator [Streptococcus phocae subsp. salmonis]KPJ21854.1 MarR family transcriptional regulator [Streptococcus phocae]
MTKLIADLRELTHHIEQIGEEMARKYDIEHLAGPQGHVLVFLEQHENKEIFVKDIEKRLQISKSVTSNLVKRMEKNGFIQVIASREDKRYKQVVLTESGRQKIPLLKECRAAMEGYFLKDITKKDLDTVKAVITQLKQNIQMYKGGDTHA